MTAITLSLQCADLHLIRLTNVIGIQILAKVRQTRPREDEEIDLVDEPSLLRRPIERVPKDLSDASFQWLFLLLCE